MKSKNGPGAVNAQPHKETTIHSNTNATRAKTKGPSILPGIRVNDRWKIAGLMGAVVLARKRQRRGLLKWAAGKMNGMVGARMTVDEAAAILCETAALAGLPPRVIEQAILPVMRRRR